MRISIALITLITAPAMLVACASTPDEPVRGTVVEKEFEPARHCPTTSAKNKQKRKTHKPCTPRRECYELDILLDYNGQIVEICDRAAYLTLDVEDRYSSDVDYNREEH